MNKDSSTTIKAVVVVCVMLLSAITSGWMLTAKPLGDHESYVTITAREMLESDDWVVPTCNGQLRLEKTPLNYWMTAAIGKIRGGVDDLAGKLPSMLLAMLSTAAILYFVSRWLGFRTAVMAALIWSTSTSFVRYGHSGRPEMSLTCFVAICFLSFYTAMIETRRKRQVVYMLIFWVSFSLAMLAKGPAPLPLVTVPLFFWVLMFKKWKQIPRMLPVIGGIIFLAAVLAWPVLLGMRMAQASGGDSQAGFIDFWKREFIDRFMGSHAAGDKPFYYYFYVMFQLMVPWVVFVPMAIAAPFYKVWGEKRKVMVFLWLWFAADVLFMSLSGGKRMHYILPAMPAMAILIGILLEDMIFIQKAHTKQLARNLLLVHVGVVIAGAIGSLAYVVAVKPEMLRETAFLAIPALIMVATAAVSFARGKKVPGCIAIFGGYCIVMMIAFAVFLVPYSSTNRIRPFALDVKASVPRSDKLVAYIYMPSRFIHYFGRTVPIIGDMSEAHAEYNSDSWIIAIGANMDELAKDSRFEIAEFWKDAARTDGKVVDGALFHKANITSPN